MGGWTCRVEQGNYGHRAPKATWLYVYGMDPPQLTWKRSDARGRVERLSKRERAETPAPFRDLLLRMARSARRHHPPAATPPPRSHPFLTLAEAEDAYYSGQRVLIEGHRRWFAIPEDWTPVHFAVYGANARFSLAPPRRPNRKARVTVAAEGQGQLPGMPPSGETILDAWGVYWSIRGAHVGERQPYILHTVGRALAMPRNWRRSLPEVYAFAHTVNACLAQPLEGERLRDLAGIADYCYRRRNEALATGEQQEAFMERQRRNGRASGKVRQEKAKDRARAARAGRARGMTQAAIAAAIGVSVRTVRTYLGPAYDGLQAGAPAPLLEQAETNQRPIAASRVTPDRPVGDRPNVRAAAARLRAPPTAAPAAVAAERPTESSPAAPRGATTAPRRPQLGPWAAEAAPRPAKRAPPRGGQGRLLDGPAGWEFD